MQYTQEELSSILELHKRWLRSDFDGKRADLRGADLSGAYLSGAYLYCANLRDADLSGANLRDAYLRGANLRDADLSGAYLRGANLRDADLSGAYLYCANLRDADLSGADLYGADLRGADLYGAKNSKLAAALTEIVPREGAFCGYKAVRAGVSAAIAKLWIPADAKRSNATGRKCRCSHARVLSITTFEGGPVEVARSFTKDPNFIYTVGETVKADGWDKDRFKECGHGIHFFLTEEEAISYAGGEVK